MEIEGARGKRFLEIVKKDLHVSRSSWDNYSCKHCIDLQLIKIKLGNTELENEERANLQVKQRELEKHLIVSRHQRAFYQHLLENLTPLDVIVIMDLTKFNNIEGEHVHDLILVVIWKENNQMKTKIFNFLAQDAKQTFPYVRAVWKELLAEPLFENFRDIWIWSDTRPQHFLPG